jgi:hypothetical protein
LLSSAAAAQRATLDAKKAILDKVDCFIFDCDGVIWRGDSVIEGVPETLDMLRKMVRPLLLAGGSSRAVDVQHATAVASRTMRGMETIAFPELGHACRLRLPSTGAGPTLAPAPLAVVQGKQLVFVTNNSTKSRAGYLKKFTGLGLDVKAEEIYSSSYAAAAYLESIQFPQDKKVYVVGEVGIQVRRERIAAGGCTCLTLPPSPPPQPGDTAGCAWLPRRYKQLWPPSLAVRHGHLAHLFQASVLCRKSWT